MASREGEGRISPSNRQIMSEPHGWAQCKASQQKTKTEHYYSSARICKHISQRALDAVEIFITIVIDSMFGVNCPCLLNLKPVAHYNSGIRNAKKRKWEHLFRIQVFDCILDRNTQKQISVQFAFHLIQPYMKIHIKYAHACTLTEATNKSPIFSLVSHSATRDASAIWNMEWHCVISLIR